MVWVDDWKRGGEILFDSVEEGEPPPEPRRWKLGMILRAILERIKERVEEFKKPSEGD